MTSTADSAYDTLPSARHIRVLILEPPSSRFSVQCRLEVISLDSEVLPAYGALSYCWGSDELKWPILCNGAVLHVTDNCHAALRRLQEAPEQAMWVDSICINQQDVTERNHQVSLMGEIYGRTQSVVIWLGEWDRAIIQAADAIHRIANASETIKSVMDELPPDPANASNFELNRGNEARLRAWQNLVNDGGSVDPILAIVRNRWFTRAWVVQEATSSTFGRIIIFGGHTLRRYIDWYEFVLVLIMLQSANYHHREIGYAIRLYRLIRNVMVRREQPQTFGTMLPWQHGGLVRRLLMSMRLKKSTDAKDKIFALYSVFQELGVKMPAPDYRKSVEQVYTEAAAICIKHDGNLYILYDVPSDNRHLRPDLPSWVPDWTDEGWQDGVRYDPRMAIPEERFHASRSATAKWRLGDNDRELYLVAKLIDQIDHCEQPLMRAEYKNEAEDDLVFQLQQALILGADLTGFMSTVGADRDRRVTAKVHKLIESCNRNTRTMRSWYVASQRLSSYPTGESLQEALLRTVSRDHADTSSERPGFDEWYDLMRQIDEDPTQADHLMPLFKGDISVPAVFNHVRKTDRPELFNSASESWILQQCHRQTFFTTTNGFMGLAPAIATTDEAKNLIQPGDRLAIFAGIAMPMVIRPINQDMNCRRYRLITHTYLHGAMYGEMWTDDSTAVEEVTLV